MLKFPLNTSPHQQYALVILKFPLSKYISPAIYNCHVKILIKYTSSHPWPYLAAIYTSQMRSDHRRRLRSICQKGYAPVCPRTTGCCHTPHIALTSSCWRPEKNKNKTTLLFPMCIFSEHLNLPPQSPTTMHAHKSEKSRHPPKS